MKIHIIKLIIVSVNFKHFHIWMKKTFIIILWKILSTTVEILDAIEIEFLGWGFV
jgi:hypothetical protein